MVRKNKILKEMRRSNFILIYNAGGIFVILLLLFLLMLSCFLFLLLLSPNKKTTTPKIKAISFFSGKFQKFIFLFNLYKWYLVAVVMVVVVVIVVRFGVSLHHNIT
jgi:hypothetical protein